MKVYIASDHRGFEIEEEVVNYLKQTGVDVCTTSLKHTDTDDYVDFAFEIAKKVSKDDNSLGILMCGTGIGMSIAANKVKGIRAARCVTTDDAFFCKNHNNANIMCIGTSLGIEKICELVDIFINTKPANEERHLKRIDKIINFENGTYNEL